MQWTHRHARTCWMLAVAAVTLLGGALRLYGLNKPDGLWYDELMSFSTTAESFPFGILHRLYHQDFHAPLYYLILHPWFVLFHRSELALRFFSVVFGVAILPVLYRIGVELGSRKSGVYAALLASVNSCLIYYSQEVRFYSLLPLLVALSVLFTVRIRHAGRMGDCLGLALSNLLILYTYTMGMLFVALHVAAFGVHLLLEGRRATLRRVAIVHVAVLLLYVPYVPTVLHFMRGASRSLVGDFWWVRMGPASPILVLQDWFTPILTNLRSHPADYYRQLIARGVDLFAIAFIAVPMSVCLAGCAMTALRKDFVRTLFLVGLLYFGTVMTLAYFGKMGPMTRHTIIALPIMITSVGAGLAGMRNQRLSAALIAIYVSLCLSYLLFGVASASTAPRDGYRKYIVEIEKCQPTSKDVVIIPYGSRSFAAYYRESRARLVPFDMEAMYLDGLGLDRVLAPATIAALSFDPDADKAVLRPYFASPGPSTAFDTYFQTSVLSLLQPGGRLFLVVSGQINPFDAATLQRLAQNEDAYRRVPLYLMLTSKTINDLYRLSRRYLASVVRKDYPGWELYIFQAGTTGSEPGR
ncbi:MAG: glycosyltransferase family 39 protein [Lentisphaerae bacterium]|nr:glycosyltransferase family 39 protein [Lentisphaerota bacterium]